MVWSRPNLPLKTRSLVTLAMLTARDRPDEVLEVFVHASIYRRIPAANNAMRVALGVPEELGLLTEAPSQFRSARSAATRIALLHLAA